jgi:hypothetical protein
MRYRALGATPEDPRLGRLIPDDFDHVTRWPMRAVMPETIATVEHVLHLPGWHWTHDQGQEGSCVGHGAAMERAITNTAQNKILRLVLPGRRYDPIDLWDRAKLADEWPDTNPGDDNGTSARAAYDVLRTVGPRRIRATGIKLDEATGLPVVVDHRHKPDPDEGVVTNRWAQTVDEMRAAIAAGLPVTIAVNWYLGLQRFVERPGTFGSKEIFVGVGDLGRILGGHCVAVYGASDKRQAFKVKNSWGRSFPLVWLPYGTMQRLLDEYGEAALVTDRK